MERMQDCFYSIFADSQGGIEIVNRSCIYRSINFARSCKYYLLTQQRPYSLQVAFQEVVDHPKYDATKRVFRVRIRPSREEIVHSRSRRSRVIYTLRRWCAQDVISHIHFLKCLCSLRVSRKLAVEFTCFGQRRSVTFVFTRVEDQIIYALWVARFATRQVCSP